ncbi:MAG: HAMP domain-containing protein [Burkholderiales bacterium]|nr:HAMP domain-containing protein [Burkholderiales bacterium]
MLLWLRRFSIRARLILCMALVVLIGLTIGGVMTLDLQRTRGVFDGFVAHEFSAVLQANELAQALSQMRGHEKDMLINAGDTVSVSASRKAWAAAHDRAVEHARGVRDALRDAALQAEVATIEARLKAYAGALGPSLDMLEGGSVASPAEAANMVAGARDEIVVAEQALTRLDRGLSQAASGEKARLGEHIQRSLVVLWLLLWTPGAIFLPLMVLTIVSVIRPLQQAEKVAKRIAHGDLGHRVDTRGADEIAGLMRTLQGMQDGLRQMVHAVRQSTEGMLTASSEIAAGNQDLSDRTEQTAANLQQTASSMEQLNSSVRLSADAARSANDLAATACQRAEHGGVVVGEVMTNMDSITEASRKIGDIIGVIDSIAFQTNILALNAAVEAARAGEQGRGFAVVAAEVRSLAQRSAQAAREIKTLIQASVERVETGSSRVRDAGAVMQEIVQAIHSVTHAMAGVAEATVQQTQGLGEVSQAVGHLDQMTQQNAALVEESAAAAASLKAQADALARLVARFQLEAQEQERPPALAEAGAPVAPAAAAA